MPFVLGMAASGIRKEWQRIRNNDQHMKQILWTSPFTLPSPAPPCAQLLWRCLLRQYLLLAQNKFISGTPRSLPLVTGLFCLSFSFCNSFFCHSQTFSGLRCVCARHFPCHTPLLPKNSPRSSLPHHLPWPRLLNTDSQVQNGPTAQHQIHSQALPSILKNRLLTGQQLRIYRWLTWQVKWALHNILPVWHSPLWNSLSHLGKQTQA